MHRFALSTRLTVCFIAIMALCFAVVGALLFRAVADRFYVQDEVNLVLSTRHLRRLVSELATPRDLVDHRDRLTALILGDAAVSMRIVDNQGRVLVEHPAVGGQPAMATHVVPGDQRVLRSDVTSWDDGAGNPVRGVSALARLQDKTPVTISVARTMTDRAVVLARYRHDITLILLSGGVLAVVLSYLLVRRAMRPLRTMADNARAITAQRLGSRMSMRDTPAELHDLALSLNAMLERLEHGFGRVWQFTVDLAHDLRTPIGNLRGANEVALARPRTAAEYQALLGSNIEECDRVSRTIESVLFLARAESPQFALQRTTFDAVQELTRIADYFEGLSSEAGVSIRVDGHASLHADRELFRRAVGNLLSNALRYTDAGKSIDMTAAAVDDGVTVSVANEGPGIDAAHLDQLFDRFYRVDRSRSDSASSTGLGLSIVKSIMELHGGQVTVSSQLQGITCFTLWFPRSTGPEHESAARP
ncbi:heavy metal sensor histidine kinase [Dyella soli]|uniref:Sensor protein n=1 Tax=Dyella soli TaxID=522319 RepID=A0A4R0YWJ7_9GAMM|nr:heavy metal sensor histidine kinase [Dyella soli]TCI11383.1 heavy metal sensor histidine kinase [Dyella soli]